MQRTASQAVTEDHLAGGSLTAAISNAMVRVLHEYTGRGPTRVRTSIRDDIVTVLMHETLIKAEQKLIEDGKVDMVLEMRRCIQRTMRDDLVRTLEEITGRRVLAFMSDNHVAPDLAIEVFVLEPAGQNGSAGEGARADAPSDHPA